MAHFAELDDNNKVLRVIVVDNKDILDESGNESEEIGKMFCHNLLGGRWIQTSYNSNFRKRYAGIGDEYRPDFDAFIRPKNYPSWVMDSESLEWKAPIPYPTDGLMYQWNEEIGDWEALTFEVPD